MMRQILSFGADKISINSPALADPTLITRLADRFGVQCIVVGIDTWYDAETGKYHVNQYTGDESRTALLSGKHSTGYRKCKNAVPEKSSST
ncbi:hypothetical protein DKG79_05030 [Escherichia fergusonii]|nr:hypothetical protein DKG79_05030 [Escherichia fergusonii]